MCVLVCVCVCERERERERERETADLRLRTWNLRPRQAWIKMIKALPFIRRADRYFFLLHWKVELSLGILTRKCRGRPSPECQRCPAVRAEYRYLLFQRQICSQPVRLWQISANQWACLHFNSLFTSAFWSNAKVFSSSTREKRRWCRWALLQELTLYLLQRRTFYYYYWNAEFEATILFFLGRNEALDYMGKA